MPGICVEEDLHGVGVAHDDWRHKVTGRSWRTCGIATALVHQGCPVPICYLDMVAVGTVGTVINVKTGEIKPQYFPALHLNRFCLCHVRRVELREVWRADNTCE